MAIEPPTTGGTVFFNQGSEEFVIKVPQSSVEAYKNAWWDYWFPLGFTPLQGFDMYQGDCGKDLKWYYEYNEDENKGVLSLEGTGTEIDNYTGIGFTPWWHLRDEMQEIRLPSTLQRIGDYAFSDLPYVKSVTLPDSLVELGSGAFSCGTGLTEIDIPDSVTKIGASCFSACSGLEKVLIGENVTNIGKYAFGQCDALKEIIIKAYDPPDLEREYGDFFPSNAVIKVPYSRLDEYKDRWLSEAGKIYGFDEGICGDNLTWYYDEYAKVLSIEGTGTDMYDYELGTSPWYKYRTIIKEIRLPSALERIGDYAFQECTAVETVVIPDSVKSLGKNSFGYCHALKSVTFGQSVDTVGPCAFVGCHALEAVDFPDSVRTLGSQSFDDCYALGKVTIGGAIQTIESCVFAQDSNLTYTTCIALTPPTLGKDVFASLPANAVIRVPRTVLEDYTNKWSAVASHIRAIDDYSGECGNDLTWCYDQYTQVLWIEGSGTAINDYTFDTVPWRVHAGEITEVRMSPGIKRIGNYAFSGLTLVKSFTLPSGLAEIGNSAFAQCAFHKIELPETVTSIGSEAFTNNRQLKIIGCKGITPATIGEKVFKNISASAVIYVPRESVDTYRDEWREYARMIVAEGDVACWGKDAIDAMNNTGTLRDAMMYAHTNAVSYIKLINDTVSVYDMEFTNNTATLDLNGKLLSLNGAQNIMVAGSGTSLTIVDSDPEAEYLFREDKSAGGLWRYDAANGTQKVFGGCVFGGSATNSGGAVSIGAGATLTMRGGNIIGNRTTEMGGGVWVDGAFNIAGNVVIKGNCGTGKFDDVGLNSGKVITVEGALGDAAEIWVHPIGEPQPQTLSSMAVATGMVTQADADKFKCAVDGCELWFDEAKKGVYLMRTCFTVGDYTYHIVSLADREVEVVGGNPAGENWTIPGSATDTDMGTNFTVVAIGDHAFENCRWVESVIIPDSVKRIGAGAFAKCSSLVKIAFPERLNEIGERAFHNCANLTEAVLGYEVTSIGAEAFLGCKRLTSLVCKTGQVPALGETAFDVVSPYFTIHVPEGSVAEYRDAWIAYADRIHTSPAPSARWGAGAGVYLENSGYLEDAVAYAATNETAYIMLVSNATVRCPLRFTANTTTLDLNGCVIDLIGKNIEVANRGTTLKIVDSNDLTEHRYAEGENGKWVLSERGGIHVVRGGVITGGWTEKSGGALKIGKGASVEMSGGNIIGNSAAQHSGAVAFEGDFTVAGKVAICGNVAGGAVENIYVASGAALAVAGALADEAKIGVMVENPPALGKSVEVARGVDYGDCYAMTSNDVARIASDNGGYFVRFDETRNSALLEKIPAVGDVFTVDGINYRITSKSPKKVEVVSTDYTSFDFLTIPDEVTDGDNGGTYIVASIGERAFYDSRHVTLVTIGANVKSIGDKAFYWCECLRAVVCNAPTPPKLGVDVFRKTPLEGIFVPAGAEEAYRQAWGEYAELIGATPSATEVEFGPDEEHLANTGSFEAAVYFARTNGCAAIKLIEDVKAVWEIKFASVEVTLDLNGHALDLGGVRNIAVEGEGAALTIKDGNPSAAHRFSEGEDGLWTLDEQGELTVNGGVITGGWAAERGGAIAIGAGAKVVMKGGAIVGNRSADVGGGIAVAGDLEVSGDAVVKGNASDLYGRCNVEIVDGAVVTVAGAMGANAEIGLSAAPPAEGVRKIVAAVGVEGEYALTKDDYNKFFSDSIWFDKELFELSKDRIELVYGVIVGDTITVDALDYEVTAVRPGEAVVARNTVSGTIEIPVAITNAACEFVVSGIAEGAFDGCADLHRVICLANEPQSLGAGAFDNTADDFEIFVPLEAKDRYIAAWSAYADRIGVYGTCGEDLYWFCGLHSRVLTIVGDGATMDDYAEGEAPWHQFAVEPGIETLVINAPNLTHIGAGAFYGLAGISEATIPATVNAIGANAFKGCTKLEKINCMLNTPPTLGAGAFDDIGPYPVIYVPLACVSQYREAEGWSNYARIIMTGDAVRWTHTAGSTDFMTGTIKEAVEFANTNSAGLCHIQFITNVALSANMEFTAGKTTIDLKGNLLILNGDKRIRAENADTELTIIDSAADLPHPFSVADDGLWVYDETNWTEKVNGGIILGGKWADAGDGIISVDDKANVYWRGGAIIGNAATEAGAILSASTNLSVSGAVMVKGNTVAGKTSNFTVANGNLIHIDGALAAAAEIWVNFPAPEYNEAEWVAKGAGGYVLTDADERGFVFSDRECEKKLDAEGNSILAWRSKIEIEGVVYRFTSIGANTADVWDNRAYAGTSAVIANAVKAGDAEYSVVGIIAGAFAGCEHLELVRVECKVPPTLGEGAFEGTDETLKIEVAYSKVYAYKAAWPEFAERIGRRTDAEISCGGDLWWDYDDAAATLIIYGDGTTMDDWSSMDKPWQENLADIATVQFHTPNLKNIGAEFCKGASNLTSIAIPTTVTKLGDASFAQTKLAEVEVPESVTTLGSSVFRNDELLGKVVLPTNITSMGSYVFTGTPKLTNVTIKTVRPPKIASNTFDIGEINAEIYVPYSSVDAYKSAENWSSLKSRIYPIMDEGMYGSCGSGGPGSLNWCYDQYAKVLTIYGSGFTIPMTDYADGGAPWYRFAAEPGIDEVVITANNIWTIGAGAFYGLTNVTTVTIPSSVISIGSNAFKGCAKLGTINCSPTSPPTLGAGAFDGIGLYPVIYVPRESVYTYRDASGWMNYKTYIVPAGDVVRWTDEPGSSAYQSGTINDAVEYANTSTRGVCFIQFTTNVVLTEDMAFAKNNTTIDLRGNLLILNGGNRVRAKNAGTVLTITDSVADLPHPFSVAADGLWVYDATNATGTVRGGILIGGRYSDGNGEIIKASYGAKVYWQGGAIVGNTANAGAILTPSADLLVSGGVSIKGNTVGGRPSNFAVASDNSISIDGALADTAEIWVNLPALEYNESFPIAKGAGGYALTKADENGFFFGDDEIEAELDKTGNSMLAWRSRTDVDGVVYRFTSAGEPKMEVGDNRAYAGKSVVISNAVTVGGAEYPVVGIGAGAFAGCKNLELVRVDCENPPALGAGAFDEASSSLKIEVAYTRVETYKSAWPDEAARIQARTDKAASCGSNLWWDYEDAEAVLHIYGDGSNMAEWPAMDRPWQENLTNIVTVQFHTPNLGNIGAAFCQSASNLTAVTIPTTVNKLGAAAFARTMLKEVVVPESVTTIEHSVFRYDVLLEKVVLPSNIISMGDMLFCDNPMLTNVTITTVKPPTIVSNTFDIAKPHTKIYVHDESLQAYKSARYWEDIADQIYPIEGIYGECGEGLVWYYDQHAKELIIFGEGTTMTDYDESGMPWLDYSGSIERVEFRTPNLTNVGNYAFNGHKKIVSVVFPESLKRIGQYSFQNCESLKAVKIPDAVELIDYRAFRYCFALSSVDLGKSLITLGRSAFVYCTSLKTVEIPDSVETIQQEAFHYNSLESLTIGGGVTDIGPWAFGGCVRLTNVVCKAIAPPSWGNPEVFSDMPTNAVIYVPAGSVDAYKAAENWSSLKNQIQGLKEEGNYGTCGSNLNWCYDQYAKVLVIDGDGTTMNEWPSKDRPWQENLTNIVTVQFHTPNLGNIGAAFCQGASNLTAVTIPTTVSELGAAAFARTMLKEVVVPESVTNIEHSVFRYDVLLEKVVLPSNIMSMGDMLFCDNPMLTNVTIKTLTPPTITSSTFERQPHTMIYVPNESLQAYKSAQYWRDIADQIFPITDEGMLVADSGANITNKGGDVSGSPTSSGAAMVTSGSAGSGAAAVEPAPAITGITIADGKVTVTTSVGGDDANGKVYIRYAASLSELATSANRVEVGADKSVTIDADKGQFFQLVIEPEE